MKSITEEKTKLRQLGMHEEYKTTQNCRSNLVSRPKMMPINDKTFSANSFRHKKHSNMMTSNKNELPSVSVGTIRRAETKSKKSSMLKQIKKRHPNSKLFKGDSFQDQFHHVPMSKPDPY